MRISELCGRAGVPLSAVKYYQREGLVPEGERSAPNQVEYGDAHVRRVRLIRALLETGGLSIAATKEVLGVLDAEDTPLAETFHVAQQAMATPRTKESAPTDDARTRILDLARAHGWAFTDDNPGIDTAARALDGLHAIGYDAPPGYLDSYADAAAGAASADLLALSGGTDTDEIAQLMVVGTVLGDPLFAGLRRIAQEHSAHRFFPVDGTTPEKESTP